MVDMATTVTRIQAKWFSLGGVMLAGVLLLLLGVLIGSVSFASKVVFSHAILGLITFAFALYLFDACSEVLSLDGDWLRFTSRLRKARSIDLCHVRDIFIVHEGLNDERGIIRIRFTDADGHQEVIALGPCWRRHEVEGLFRLVEKSQKSCKLVEQIR